MKKHGLVFGPNSNENTEGFEQLNTLNELYERVKQAWAHQDCELRCVIEQDKRFQPTAFMIRKLCHSASQRNLRERPPSSICNDSLTATMGIPCSHRIYSILHEENRVLLPTDFSMQWRLQSDEFESRGRQNTNSLQSQLSSELETLQTQYTGLSQSQQHDALQQIRDWNRGGQGQELIQHPSIQKTKGRPRGSVHRDPIGSERVEQQQRMRERNELQHRHRQNLQDQMNIDGEQHRTQVGKRGSGIAENGDNRRPQKRVCRRQ
ncbi:hypothetical protein BJ508DRAFT_307867 [Ascobolus immersus RN42]|uniref:SWIM-type domain-containing protein n=1 Tax=Ascobolus immersus RN42 TaxID=1160509 RepID=A0A3N4I1J6_ASCIM|nr:hypothetical protein BJ508DRAFT_307867 [Ascobolus immersus RN42]